MKKSETKTQTVSVELKSVKFHDGMDGIGFNATLFINGTKTADLHDAGYGAIVYDVRYIYNDENWKLFQDVADAQNDDESHWPKWQDVVDQLLVIAEQKNSTRKVLFLRNGVYYTFNKIYKKSDHLFWQSLLETKYAGARLISGNPISVELGM